MRRRGNQQSENVGDRRGSRRSLAIGGALGLGGVAIALIASLLLGANPMRALHFLGGTTSGASVEQSQASDRTTQFIATVLADTEDTWSAFFSARGRNYAAPTLVLFSDDTPTACGAEARAMGPFYCPTDQKLYIDLGFFRLLAQRFEVAGEFAQAYVIAHEVGHHVQHLLGISSRVQAAQRRSAEADSNALSLRLELQADCFAGVWAHHADRTRKIVEAGDVEAALKAASAIGVDALQRRSQDQAVPDSFTHGTSAQRVRWFTSGLQTGSIAECNTFGATEL